MRTLEGRAAIITGAGDGIGLGIARRYAKAGASVLVAEINAETGEAAVEGLRQLGAAAHFLKTDVTRKDQVLAMVDTAVERFGRLDILVNNAWGGTKLGRLEFKKDETMAHGLAMAFWAAHWSMQAAFPHMQAQGWGRIINICSLNGVNAHMYSAEYNVSKEALRTLTRTAAREWARTGIVANVICPAAASTAYRKFLKHNPENAAAILATHPMGRMGDPEEDIGGVAVFLASEDARYLTGNTLFVDGGGHINGVAWAPQLPEGV
jgi:NAD(P)-dependent dehydrogenase (short-subunit alcohol dehydrogenase family)